MKKPQFANRSNRYTNNNPVSSDTPSQPPLGNRGLNEVLSAEGLNPFDRQSSCHPRRRDMIPVMAPGMNPNEMAAPGGFYPPYQPLPVTNSVHSALLLDRESALNYISELKSNAYVVALGKTRTGEEIVKVEHMFTTDQLYPTPTPTEEVIILTQMSADEFINLYLDTLDTEDTFGLSDFISGLFFTVQQIGNRMYGAMDGRTYLVDQALVDQAIEEVKDVKDEPVSGFYQPPAVARLYRIAVDHRNTLVKGYVQILNNLIDELNVKPSIDEMGLATMSFVGKDMTVVVQPSMVNSFCTTITYKVTWVRHNPELAHEAVQTHTYTAEVFFDDIVPKIKQLVSE